MKQPQQLSKSGLNFISFYEGLSLGIYYDQGGKLTIGYGHLITKEDGDKFKNGITQDQAEQLLIEDIQPKVDAVNNLVTVDLNQNQFDALVSLVFNIGVGNFKTSTLLKRVNVGNHAAAATEFLRWIYVGDVVSKGLQNRRRKESKVYLS